MPTLDALKAKYRPLFELAQRRGITVTHAHLQDDKLFVKGAAPNEAIKVEAWTCIKAIDPVYADILCDIAIDPSLKVPETIYEVQSGDNLSKIAKHFYGDANKYMKIFEANKDQLADPDKIKIGQKLRIPN